MAEEQISSWRPISFFCRDACEIEVQLDYGLANPLEKCSKPLTRNKSRFKFFCPSEMQSASGFFLVKIGNINFKFGTYSPRESIFCPSEMQSASGFFLVKIGNINFKFGTYSSSTHLTFESYIRLSSWWRSIDSLIDLIVFEQLQKIEQPWIELNRSNSWRLYLQTVDKASGWKCERLKVWTVESVNGGYCSGWKGVGRKDMEPVWLNNSYQVCLFEDRSQIASNILLR